MFSVVIPEVSEVTLVSHQHDDDVGVCVVAELPQPPLNVLVRQVLGNVVHKQSTNGSPVIPKTQKEIVSDISNRTTLQSMMNGKLSQQRF